MEENLFRCISNRKKILNFNKCPKINCPAKSILLMSQSRWSSLMKKIDCEKSHSTIPFKTPKGSLCTVDLLSWYFKYKIVTNFNRGRGGGAKGGGRSSGRKIEGGEGEYKRAVSHQAKYFTAYWPRGSVYHIWL
jgi:hypothetical protein